MMGLGTLAPASGLSVALLSPAETKGLSAWHKHLAARAPGDSRSKALTSLVSGLVRDFDDGGRSLDGEVAKGT
jgi:hypothetical protein